jgi:hypothetical protein
VAKWFNYIRCEKRKDSEGGLNKSYWLYHRSLARGVGRNPYLLANEWICCNIGWYLRLPIPPFALMQQGSSKRFFASLDFGGESVATDMRPDRLVATMPYEATGLVLFDVLIANPDRHEKNLKVDNDNKPTRIEVFDHDQALLGSNKALHGITRLSTATGKLGLMMGITGTNRHKVAKALNTSDHFPPWLDQIWAIPARFIDDVCNEARELDISQQESSKAAEFLRERAKNLAEIIKANKAFFSAIKRWTII